MANDASPPEIDAHLAAAADTPPDRATANAVLAAFAAAYQLEPIALDDDGAALLTIGGEEDGITVALLHRTGGVGLFLGADMAEGTADDPTCLRLALSANGVLEATGGGIFGAAPEGTHLHFVTQVLLTGLDATSFGAALMDFAERAADWQERFDLLLDQAARTDGEAAA